MGNATHGKKARFWLGTKAAPGVPVDISGSLNEIGMPSAIDESESTTFGDEDRTYELGFKDNQINLSGRWAPAIDAQLHDLHGADELPEFEYWPAGRPVDGTPTADQPRYSGESRVTNYDRSSSIGDVSGFTATLRVQGSITRAQS